MIAFTGRTLSADEKAGPKYLNSPETPIYSKSRVLFNLHHAKEAIRKLEYAILVEGQMDCISVYAAGFHNVIASSGTAFTDAQARLLGRFSHRIVVNFDPDTAGAAAAERSLTLLVEEDFEIKVLTLEAGFDPDLFIRKKGCAELCCGSQSRSALLRLPDRARSRQVSRPHSRRQGESAELPASAHPARAQPDRPHGARERNLAEDRHRLRRPQPGVEERRHLPPVADTEAGACPSGHRLRAHPDPRSGHAKVSSMAATRRHAKELTRSSIPALQARFALEREPLHQGLGAETLISAILAAPEADPTALELSDTDRRLLSQCLLREEEELTPELLEAAIGSLRRRTLERRQRQIRAEIVEAERRNDSASLSHLLREKLEVDRALSQSHLS